MKTVKNVTTAKASSQLGDESTIAAYVVCDIWPTKHHPTDAFAKVRYFVLVALPILSRGHGLDMMGW